MQRKRFADGKVSLSYVTDCRKAIISKEELDIIQIEIERRKKSAKNIAVKTSPSDITECDDLIWITTISKATIHHDGKITFEFKDGSQVEI